MTAYRGGQSMGVLIGIDPHKSVNAAAAIDEQGELAGHETFPANQKGLRALERWAKRFPERRWAVEGAAGIGRPVAQRLARAGEKVVDVPPKLSSKARLLSTGNARKNDRLDATFTAQAALRSPDPDRDADHSASSAAPGPHGSSRGRSMRRFAVRGASLPCGPQSDPKKLVCMLRCSPKGSPRGPKREPTKAETPRSGQLALAATQDGSGRRGLTASWTYL
jgi:hypothetical protein